MLSITLKMIKEKGQYIGFQKEKGYIYAVPVGKREKDIQKYAIVSLLSGEINILHYTHRRIDS